MDPSIKVETPTVELPNNENKLFDEEDDVGTSTIPHLSLPSEDEEEEVKSNNVWEYAIGTEFRQPLQVQSHLEMPGILVQLGHIQHTKKLAPQIDLKWSPTRSLRRYQAICPLRARD